MGKNIKNSKKNFLVLFFGLMIVLLQTNCVSIIPEKSLHLTYLDEFIIPNDQKLEDTEIGGLSGIDYNQKENVYYLISDDRSVRNPARIYKAKINIIESKIKNIDFQNVIYLKDAQDNYYTSSKINPLKSIDPEDVRYSSKNDYLVYTNEGERLLKEDKNILQNPSIIIADKRGGFVEKFLLPDNLKMTDKKYGPRRNGVLEGLSFNDDFSKLYVNVEVPLYEDGLASDLNNGGIVRFFEFNTATLKNTKQYLYPLDPIANAPNPKDAFAVNGVSAILNYKKNHFLVVERSYSTGYNVCTIKIYDFDISKAQKIINKDKIGLTKRLILNLDSLPISTDNIEGISFGPILENGKQSLLLISDNNFSSTQKTQILLFSIDTI